MSVMIDFRDDPFKTIINQLLTIELRMVFRGSYKITQLSSYLDGLAGTDGRRVCLSSPSSNKTFILAGDILDAGLSECWIILLSPSAGLIEVIEESLDELENERIDIEDFARSVCRKVVLILAGYVADTWRDRSYAGVRQALSASEKFVHKKVGIKGLAYAKRGTVTNESPTSTVGDKDSFYRSLDRPSPNIRGTRMVGDFPQMVWNTDVLQNEAVRFWQRYCDTFYHCPGYVLIYDFYCWLSQHLDLLPPRYTDTDGLLDLPGSTLSPEDEKEKMEIHQEVEDFLSQFTSEDKAIFDLLCSDDKTMEQVAQSLGYKSASGISRRKKYIENKLKERVSQIEREYQIIFMNYFSDLCKNATSAPTKKMEVK